MPTQEEQRPHSFAISVAVCATLAFSALAVLVLLERLADRYRAAQNLPEADWSFLPSAFREEPRITLGMIGWPNVLIFAILPATLYAFLHPVVGRAIMGLMLSLANHVDRIYEPQEKVGNWSPNLAILVGAFWPITIVALPYFAIAIVFGWIYRSLWR